MSNYITVTPGYGRDYKTAKAAKQAFLEGLDFVVSDFGRPYDGKLANIADFDNGDTVLIRYKRLEQIAAVKVTAALKVASDAAVRARASAYRGDQ